MMHQVKNQMTTWPNKTPETKALRQSSLEFFDAWAESVILRVGEVANSREDVSKQNDRRASSKAGQRGLEATLQA